MLDFQPIHRPIILRALLALVLGALVLAPASTARATTIPVSTNADTVADDGACSLREAITAANTDTASGASAHECPAGSGSDTITLPAMTFALNGQLQIDSPVELAGTDAARTVVDAQRSGSVFRITGGDVVLRGMTIRGGDAQAGGGLRVDAGTVEIRDARITDNQGFSGGAGIYVLDGATVTVRRTTIDANQATGAFGGGILNSGTTRVYDSLIGGDLAGPAKGNDSNRAGGIYNGVGAILNLINTTVSGNNAHSPEAGNGGLFNAGFAFLNNVTITRNRGRGNVTSSFSGGGLQSTSGATTVVKNSIIAGNDGRGGANDCLGALTTDSVYDLIGDTNGCILPPIEQPPDPLTFIVNTDPRLGDLLNNGGPTRTHLPAFNSPAIDAGFPFTPGGPAADACAAADQRGIPRLRCDMGAVERLVQLPTAFTVDTTLDEPDARPGDATCATASNTCSLRAAIQEANRLPGTQTINIPAGTYTLAIPPADEGGTEADAGGDLDLQGSVVLAGANRATVIIDGADLARVFDVAPGASATIRGMTIRNGTDLGGGGVRVTSAALTLDSVIVQDNVSNFKGGGIEVDGLDSVLDLRNSIVRNNRAPFFGGDGGGIAANGRITISLASITGNEASSSGGGLFASGTVNVTQSTVAGNRAVGGGVFSNGGGISASGLNLAQSTVSGNSADAQGGGVFASGTIVNSTISGNMSATSGGGASTSGTLSLLNVTIAANRATAGGNGLFRFGSTSELGLQNTILADPPGVECAGLLPVSRGSNIASDRSCGLAGGGDRQALDALIDPLADNGGPTRTHLPRFNSPAINTAASVGLAVDQRGVTRPQGARPDIGAVERRQ
jgi:CSLREA domain-containing protein